MVVAVGDVERLVKGHGGFLAESQRRAVGREHTLVIAVQLHGIGLRGLLAIVLDSHGHGISLVGRHRCGSSHRGHAQVVGQAVKHSHIIDERILLVDDIGREAQLDHLALVRGEVDDEAVPALGRQLVHGDGQHLDKSLAAVVDADGELVLVDGAYHLARVGVAGHDIVCIEREHRMLGRAEVYLAGV